jgi:hypothetical protein
VANIPNWITAKQAAALMGVTKDWLWKARDGQHAGPPYYRPNFRVLYREDEVLQFIELHRTECPSRKEKSCTC